MSDAVEKRHHGTDVLWTVGCLYVLMDYPYKNEITCVIHSIMVLSFFGPFMSEFPYKK